MISFPLRARSLSSRSWQRPASKRLEVVSFVSPKAIPQMADAKEVVAAVRDTLKAHGVRTVALVPNARGVETAVECGINELTYVISVSRSHNMANVRRTPEESMEQFKTLIQEYGHKIDFRLALATALGCPFGEEIRTERVAEMVQFGLGSGLQGNLHCRHGRHVQSQAHL